MSDADGLPAYEPHQEPPASWFPRPSTAGHLVGRVESSAMRAESRGRDFGNETTLTFRLLEPDGQRPRDVQLRGRSISGTVHDGDWVEVTDRERAGRLEVDALLNLTTGAEVKVSGSSRSAGARVFKVVFLIVFVMILLLIVWVALGMSGVVHGWPFGSGNPFGDGFDG